MNVSLSSIVKHWPPTPGPDQPETGHMTVTSVANSPVRLTSLHVPAWWTGVRLSSAARIRLTTHEVTLFSDSCPAKTWVPFAWPIPAQIAAALGMELEIETSDGKPIAVCVAFHEMPEIDIGPTKRVCFVTEKGGPSILEWSMDSCKLKKQTEQVNIPSLKDWMTPPQKKMTPVNPPYALAR